ncbi:putative N-acetyltransferase [Hamiltosporidium tvaerminnensis]|uniref:Putative N-acetyltransferase n=1 Tax=Hamiltosporidium tvaerminnensis TaxID=1176355 RepID=A0A4V2JXN8_9MICR|nr:putative N-acetyltransferase [Hamiltosporidium tvaerminnensis]
MEYENKIIFEHTSIKNILEMIKIDKLIYPLKYRKTFYGQLCNSQVKHGYLFLLDQKYIGCCSYEIDKECSNAYIMTFGIVNTFRRKGIGKICLEKLEKKLLNEFGIPIFRLHVQTSNSEALSFYKKNGYEVIKIEESYYRNILPKSAYFLEKSFLI